MLRLLLFLLLCITLHPVAALEITDAMFQEKVVSLDNDTLILQDPGRALTPETALRRMNAEGFRSDSFTSSFNQYWLYTPLINRSQHEQWTVRSYNLFFDEVDFYLYCQGQPLQYRPQPPLGFHSPTLANAYYVPVALPYDTPCGLLQYANGFVPQSRNQLLSPNVAARQSSWTTLLNLLGLGAIVGLIVYNFLLFVSVRNGTYFFYTVYACIHLALMMLVNFRAPELIDLFVKTQQALRIISASVMISALLFAFRFMQPGIEAARRTPAQPIILKSLALLIALCWAALFAMSLVVLHALIFPECIPLTFPVYSRVYLVFSLLIPLLSLVVALSGYKPAWVFLPAWSLLFASHIIGVLYFLGVIEDRGFLPTITILVAVLEMVLLSIALGMTLRESQAARDREQLARENTELRMAQQEKFVSTLSHEIRTPLHAMLGSNALLGCTPLSDKQKEYWSTTHYAAESMYALVDNLLDRTQAKQARITNKNTVFEPKRLLEAMIHLLRSRAEEKDLSLHLHTEALPNHLEGNPVILRRVLINLISNAVKYTDKGRISVHVSWSDVQSELHVIVKDTGLGMSAQQLKQVRQNFNMGVEALYNQHASSGLGLPICFEMLQEAGGRLALDSEPGQGTSVHFSLPMQSSATPAEIAEPTPEQMTDMALAVLVVDDVETNRMIARELLESAGHQVRTAESGKQALTLMQEQAFDTVLSDMRMPEMDGAQLLATLRREHSPEELIIVMTSAHFSPQQQEALLAMGATVCLPKPNSPEALLTAIQGIDLKNSKPLLSSPVDMNFNDEKLIKIRELYDKQLKNDIARINQALSQQDAQTIRIAAHRIVSASQALGLKHHADAALKIEIHDEDKKQPDWKTFRQLIEQEIQHLTDRPTNKLSVSCY